MPQTTEQPGATDLLNVQQAAEYLGLSRRKFNSLRFQIGLTPDVELERVWPRWSKRELELVRPIAEAMRGVDIELTRDRGRAFARYLTGEMELREIEQLRDSLRGLRFRESGRLAHYLTLLCRELGVRHEFAFENEAMAYRDGMLSALNEVL